MPDALSAWDLCLHKTELLAGWYTGVVLDLYLEDNHLKHVPVTGYTDSVFLVLFTLFVGMMRYVGPHHDRFF
jgi:hypothetical protein